MSTDRLTISEIKIPDDVVTRCGRRHEEEEIVGYAVVLTGFAGVKVRDLGYYDEFCRREAYEELDRLLYSGKPSFRSGWRSVRIDVLYSDGCRDREWTP